MSTTTRIRILIEGHLQGLNFRSNTKQQADQLGLKGFVRVLSDGRIEIEAQGQPEQVDQLLTWCQQKPHADVMSSIFYRYDEPLHRFNDFVAHV